MRITGYCERCRKIRTVRVTQFRLRNNVQIGICSSCEEEQDKERRERSERQKGKRN